MNLLRSLLAVLFAIMIANPACCCTLVKAEEPVHQCCGGGKKKEHPHGNSCLCATKQSKQAEDPPVLPFFAAVELPPLDESPAVPERLVAEEHPAIQPGVIHDTGPPRRRLILFQRFLI